MAYAFYLRIHRARIAVKIIAPHKRKYRFPFIYLARVRCKKLEYLHFLRRERHTLAFYTDIIIVYVYLKVVKAKHLLRVLLRHGKPSQHRLYPRHNFARAERLNYVIIRAQLKAKYPIYLFSLCR